jgi:hypothetical protein
MLISGVGLIPHQLPHVQRAEIATIGLFVLATSIVSQIRAVQMIKNPMLKWWFMRAITIPLTALPIAVGSVLQMAGIESGLYWLAFGILASLAAGVHATWVLLIEFLR